ncbi:hypothetical protein [uncultured Alloprevotella sp.]|uniref:hypothetical protein n=1 Tax=uncultured Alloprevotella sp. TaxID=1283315 RepID=UPI0026292211|nr:hypothetical protein [uncultured Alloprevotella sp.]
MKRIDFHQNISRHNNDFTAKQNLISHPISNIRFVCCWQTMIWWQQTMVWSEQTMVCRQQTNEELSCIDSKYAKQQSKAGRFSSCSASTDNAFQPLATTGKHKIDQKRRKALVASVLCYKGLCG